MSKTQLTQQTIVQIHDDIDIALASSKSYQVSISLFDNSLGARMTALANIWYAKIDKENGELIGEAEAHCKYHFGLKIRCRGDSDLEYMVRRMLDGYTYEDKKAIIRKNSEFFPVLRAMSIEEKQEYLQSIQVYYAEQGIPLSSPNEQNLLYCSEAQK